MYFVLLWNFALKTITQITKITFFKVFQCYKIV